MVETNGSWETMGSCIARIHDGFFHFPTILPAAWLQDKPNLARTPLFYASLSRGINF